MSSAPIVDRIRIIPRPNDFLDRNVGSSGEVFFNRATNSLRVYSGKDVGGFEIAKSNLTNVTDAIFLAKATQAGISGATPNWADITNKPSFATVATSGLYTDLLSIPSIPSDISDLTDNSNLLAAGGSGGGDLVVSEFSFAMAADDSTQRLISNGETVQIIGGTGITTASDAEGNITITASAAGNAFSTLTDVTTASINVGKIYEPAIAMLRVDNVGATAYTFSSHYSGNNPDVYAISGTTIAFDLDLIPGHPFEIQQPNGDPYNTGLIHVAADGTVSTELSAQGKDSGTLYWRIPETIFGGYRYQCQSHAAMVGSLTIKRLSLI
tara:strand:- start:1028 stop:2002 length:975 start_codon:yes stop_codon:yes gene_type:complete